MNTVKISVLLVVFCFLFTAVPCFAAVCYPHGQTPSLSLETVSGDNANRLLGNLELIGNSTQFGNASEPAWSTEAVYAINANVRHPEINPGQTVEIEIYLSGYGIPEKNELYINWSSPYVIDRNSPGNFAIFGHPGLPFDATSAHAEWIILNWEFFEPFISLPEGVEDYGFEPVWGEHDSEGKPPVLINLNTLNDAPSGDYQVRLTFTYGSETNLKQDFKVVEFHIRSLWERSELGLAIAGAVVALLALIISAAGTIWQIVRWHRGQ